MKSFLIALTALTLSFGTAYAANFGNGAELHYELAGWHGAATTPHVASYTDASLTEVVDGYWTTLSALGRHRHRSYAGHDDLHLRRGCGGARGQLHPDGRGGRGDAVEGPWSVVRRLEHP